MEQCWNVVNSIDDKTQTFYDLLEQLIFNKVKIDLAGKAAVTVSSIRRNRSLKDGDFLVHVRCNTFGSRPHEDPNMSTAGTNFDQLWCLYGNHISEIESGKFAIFLNKTAVFKNVVETVLQEAIHYGQVLQTSGVNRSVMINFGGLQGLMQSINRTEISLSKLRLLLAGQHLQRLLSFCSLQAHFVPCPDVAVIDDSVRDLMSRIGVSLDDVYTQGSTESDSPEISFYSKHYGKLLQRLLRCDQYLMKCEDSIVNEHSAVVLNLKQFLADNLRTDGKGRYHGNLEEAKVTIESPISHQLIALENQRNVLKPQYPCENAAVQLYCCHISESDNVFRQQQIDVAWRILLLEIASVNQVHVVSGPVTCSSSNGQFVSAKDFYWLRHQQITEAYQSKYGSKISGSTWETDIDDLTKAVVRFELLSSVSHQQIKLNSTSSNDGKSPIDSRGGIFVMYNCARLATLFHNFEESVQKGHYPPLPSSENIDWSKLQDAGEWELLFNFILPFPRIIIDCINGIYDDQSTINLHKICQFLVNLTSRLSVYYSKTHILCEPRPHLLGLIHARLYLMKAVQQVMHNALALLGIKPFNRL